MCFITGAAVAGGSIVSGLSTAQIAGLAISAMSTAATMYGSHKQGEQAEKVGEINAQQANIEAQLQKETGLDQAQKSRERTRQMIARQSAEAAAGGGDTTQGSTLDILKDSARFGAEDEANTLVNAERQSLSSLNESRQAMAKGKFGAYSSRLNVTGSAMSGAGAVSDKWYRYINA